MTSGVSYNYQTVAVDGEAFSDCDFAHCRLVYTGGATPQFDNCRFTDCDWTFQDAAADTLAYLKLIWSLGAKVSVQAAIKEITVAAR